MWNVAKFTMTSDSQYGSCVTWWKENTTELIFDDQIQYHIHVQQNIARLSAKEQETNRNDFFIQLRYILINGKCH